MRRRIGLVCVWVLIALIAWSTRGMAQAARVRIFGTDTSGNAVPVGVTSGALHVNLSGGAAPTAATFITQVAESGLSAEQALAALATGLMVSTTTTGVVSTLAPTDDNVTVGNGTAWQIKALTTCTGAGKAVTYDASANTFGCNSVTGTDTHVAFFDGANTVAGDPGMIYNKTTDAMNLGVNYAAVLASDNPGVRIGSNVGGFGAALYLASDDENTGAPNLYFYSSNGTTATPTATTAGNILGNIDARGYQANAVFGGGARITFSAVNIVGNAIYGGLSLVANTPTDGFVTYLNLDGNAATMTAPRGLIVGTAGVKLTGDGDGALTFLGLGDGSDESITINLDDTADTVVWSTSTGVTLFDFAAINLRAPGYRTTTNCADAAGAAACGAAAAGAVVIDAAATTVVVSTTAVTATSRILITEAPSLATELVITCNTTAGRTYTVTALTAATSFTITTDAAPVTNPACLQYWIVN